MEKVRDLFSRPSDNEANGPDDAPWWMKPLARAAGTVGGAFAIVTGIIASTGILLADVGCLFGGVWLMLAGFLAILLESPCCCPCIDFVSTLSQKFEGKPSWQRAALYVVISMPPLIFCRGITIFFGCACIFGTGIIYGLIFLGKKASKGEMSHNASTILGGGGVATMKSSLVSNEQPPSMSRFDGHV